MLGTLIRKELLANLRTMRLVVSLVFTVVLCMLTTVINSLDYSASVEEFRGIAAEIADDLDVSIYRDIVPKVITEPQPLHILSRGMLAGNSLGYWIFTGHYVRSMGRFDSGWHDLMVVLLRADFTAVVALVLTFLAIVLGFDGICGEKEQGTLRLLLSNSVSRGDVVAAKLIGGMVSLLVPLLIAFCGSLMVIQSNPDVMLTATDWSRLLLLFLLSGLLLGLIFSLSLMVSTFIRSSATSLIVCLFCWLAGGVGYVNVLPAIARYAIPYPPYQEYVGQQQQAEAAFERDLKTWDAKNPRPAAAYMVWQQRGGMIRFGHPLGYKWLERRTAYEFERSLERADQVYTYHWANQGPLAEQEYMVDRWSVLSPITNYRTLSKLLVGSSVDDFFYAVDFSTQYRETYIQWLRGRMQTLGWKRWFTDDPPGQEPMIPNPEAVDAQMLADDSDFMKSRRLWAQQQEDRLAAHPRKHLNLGDLPKHGPGWKRGLSEALIEMGPGLLVMVFSFVLSLMITVRKFLRYELS